MAGYTYTKINWENEPSYNTPINETNLNHMDQGIFDLAYVKAEKNDAVFVNSISLDRKAGTAVGLDSVAAGYDTEATGPSSVAIGTNTSAKNGQAVAGGYNSKALGNTSLALGTHCITRLNAAESQAIGNNCIAGSANQMVFGQYNVEDTTGTYAEIVGNGSSGNESNARTLDWQGNETIAGDFTNGNGETLHGIYEALPVDTESGNPAVITDAFGGSCKSLKLTLEPIQSGSGTPSPDNVRPISGRTNSLIASSGKPNAMPSASAKSGTINNVTYSCDGNGKYEVHTTGATQNTTLFFDCPEFIIPDKNSAVLGLMNASTPYNVTFDFYYNESRVDYWQFSALNRITQYGSDMSNKKCNRFAIQVNTSSAFDLVMTPMICYGTTSDFPSAYKPFGGTSITIPYGQTLYGASVDVTGGEATVNYATLTEMDYASAPTGTSAGGLHWTASAVLDIDTSKPILCSMLPYRELDAAWSSTTPCYTLLNTNQIRIYCAESTLETFRTNYADLQFCYKINTPTSIPLTSQDLPLLKGDNVLTTDADSIEASYSADIALYIEKKIAEGSNNRSLAKGGASEEEPKEDVTEEEIEEPKKEETR